MEADDLEYKGEEWFHRTTECTGSLQRQQCKTTLQVARVPLPQQLGPAGVRVGGQALPLPSLWRNMTYSVQVHDSRLQ